MPRYSNDINVAGYLRGYNKYILTLSTAQYLGKLFALVTPDSTKPISV